MQCSGQLRALALQPFAFSALNPSKRKLWRINYINSNEFCPRYCSAKKQPVKSCSFQPCPSQVSRQCNRRRYTADKVKNHCYRDGSALQRAAGNSLHLLPALPRLARVGAKFTAHNLSYIWPWIEPLTAFCSARALGGWRDIKSAL